GRRARGPGEQGGECLRSAIGGGERVIGREHRLGVGGRRAEVGRAGVAGLDVAVLVFCGDGERERRTRRDGSRDGERERGQRGRYQIERRGGRGHADGEYRQRARAHLRHVREEERVPAVVGGREGVQAREVQGRRAGRGEVEVHRPQEGGHRVA